MLTRVFRSLLLLIAHHDAQLPSHLLVHLHESLGLIGMLDTAETGIDLWYHSCDLCPAGRRVAATVSRATRDAGAGPRVRPARTGPDVPSAAPSNVPVDSVTT